MGLVEKKINEQYTPKWGLDLKGWTAAEEIEKQKAPVEQPGFYIMRPGENLKIEEDNESKTENSKSEQSKTPVQQTNTAVQKQKQNRNTTPVSSGSKQAFMTNQQKKAWYSRYTRDQIKQIQAALNKAAIGGEALAVDGIVGDKTIAAIERYQRQFENPYGGMWNLKVDGLAGDKTLASLGINFRDKHLPSTRSGVTQSRFPSNLDRVEEAVTNHNNSKKFEDWVFENNLSQEEYNRRKGFAEGAVNSIFLNPQTEAKIRVHYNLNPDAYDRDLVAIEEDAAIRQEGKTRYKDWLNGQSNFTSKDYVDFQRKYGLTNDEMLQLIENGIVREAVKKEQDRRTAASTHVIDGRAVTIPFDTPDLVGVKVEQTRPLENTLPLITVAPDIPGRKKFGGKLTYLQYLGF